MTAFVEIDGSVFGDIRKHLADLPDVLDRGLLAGIMEASLLLQWETAERTPSAAGALRGSIIAAMPERTGGFAANSVDGAGRAGGAVLGVVGSPLAYAEPVELGTKPHMPPLQPILDWVTLRLGLKGGEAKKAAEAIRWKIHHHGTQGAFMFRDALKANHEQMVRKVEEALRRELETHRQRGGANA
ncbi:MAG: hypothetical protein HQL34_05525 [Alphaproteobacteria bacterium]|nr:hypothetical protein [Alphaproteobacteria bacterium]